MALYQKLPKLIRLEIPEEDRQLYGDFNTLCVLEQVRPIDAITALVRDKVLKNHEVLQDSWLAWNEFEAEMLKRGYTVNRTTFFNYRSELGDLVRSDGVSTRYNLEGILKWFGKQ